MTIGRQAWSFDDVIISDIRKFVRSCTEKVLSD